MNETKSTIRVSPPQEKQKGAFPTIVEILLIFAFTNICSLLAAIYVKSYIGTKLPLVPWASHVPQLVIPWIWYRFRVAPLLPSQNRSLWRWPKGSGRLLWLIGSWLITLQVLGNIADIWGKTLPSWIESGAPSIILIILFQGVFVGFSEEMLMRPALHLPISMRVKGGIRIFGRWHVSYALLITALCFGLFHLGNLFSQPLVPTLMQATFATIIGVIFGYYYERTGNYLGTALLHNLLDVSGYVLVLIVSLWR